MKRERPGRVALSAELYEAGLSPRAQRSSASRGRARPDEPCSLRTAYQRDRDRIVHSKSFRRLKHKTQVFISPEGDHYRTRLTHTLEVSGIARTAARALRLNEDLAEAIALGHDLGHTPFGHAGESVLDEVLRKMGMGGFQHNEQSARVVEVAENDGQGLNLTWEVMDGIRHHSGDDARPATLEAEIVHLADRIAYVNHDIDDALRAGLITPGDLPTEPVTLLGETAASASTPWCTTGRCQCGGAGHRADAPAASTQRVIDMLHIRNADTADATVTVKFDANGTEYILLRELLQPGDTIHYADGAGFAVSRTYQDVKIIPVHADGGANFAMSNATQAERFAGNSSRHLFVMDLVGYTQVRMIVNKMVGSASVNTPIFRAKYYTEYNTTVANFLQLGSAAQVEVSMVAAGYADTGWMFLAAGARIDGCCIGFTELGGDGVADPALGFTQVWFR